jgi:hypothetical protein
MNETEINAMEQMIFRLTNSTKIQQTLGDGLPIALLNPIFMASQHKFQIS